MTDLLTADELRKSRYAHSLWLSPDGRGTDADYATIAWIHAIQRNAAQHWLEAAAKVVEDDRNTLANAKHYAFLIRRLIPETPAPSADGE